jgi:hypothetical protein
MRIHTWVCRSVWSAALVGTLLAGCGGETDANREELKSSEPESEAVFESFTPTADARGDSEGASGQPSAGQVQALGRSCPNATLSWFEAQSAWNSNGNTAGTYSCSVNAPGASDSSNILVQVPAGGERTGSAVFRCSDGTWQFMSGSCNGNVVSTLTATGNNLVCSHSDPVRSKWIGWYVADLKRCADAGGLDWWVNQYNSNNGCLASTNYDGYGSRDACFRAGFQASAGSEYTEAQSTGHIAAQSEYNACGPRAAYPYSNVFSDGAKCKYRP